ncbi:Cochaperone prefoldin complex subunit [Elasticomyces elasticus]
MNPFEQPPLQGTSHSATAIQARDADDTDNIADAQHKPRYLFRAASDNSRGLNTAIEVDPLRGYTAVPYRADLASIPTSDATQMLRAHLKWNYNVPSEFSSWSVSLLWVLVHAVRKTTVQKGYWGEDPSRILIYVLDTEAITTSRVHRSKDLVSIFRLHNIPFIDSYSQGEYLIHGRLQAADGFMAVSLSMLIHAGLYDKFPGLRPDEVDEYKLHIRSQILRSEYSDATWPLSPRVTPTYRALGACFGRYWEGFMTLAFISVRTRGDLSREEDQLVLFLDLDLLPFQQVVEAPNPAYRALTVPDDGIAEADQLANWLYLFRTLVEKQFLDEERQNAEKQEAEEDVADLLGGLTVNDNNDVGSSSDPIAGRAYPAKDPLPPQQLSKGKAAAIAAMSGSVHDGAAKKSSSTTRKRTKGKTSSVPSSSASQHNLDAGTSSLAESSSAASTATTNVPEADTETSFYAEVSWNCIIPESKLSKWSKSAAGEGDEQN